MHVAAAQISLHLPASQSLKDRRRIVRSLVERAQTRFNASIADVGIQDRWQLAEIGLCLVSGSKAHAQDLMDELVRYVEGFSPEAIVTGVEVDIVSFDS